LPAEAGFVISLDFSPDGLRLASAHRGLRKVVLWALGNRNAVGVLPQFKDEVGGAKFSPDGRVLAVHTHGDTVTTLWSPDSLERVGALDGVHVEGVSDIAFAHKQRLVATAGFDRQLVVWSLETRRRVAAPLKPEFSVNESPTIVWSANDEFLLTNAFEVRSAKDGRVLQKARSFVSFAVSRLTQRVAVAVTQRVAVAVAVKERVAVGIDEIEVHTHEIELWQAHSNRWAAPTLPLQGKADVLAFSPDGRVLATGEGGSLRIWDLDVESWLAMACRIANRNLTSAEWAEAFDVPYRRTCPQFPDPPPEPQRVF
jgi:WD40 repeat protein